MRTNPSTHPQIGIQSGCCSSWRRCRQPGRVLTAGPRRAPGPCWHTLWAPNVSLRAARTLVCQPAARPLQRQPRAPHSGTSCFTCYCHEAGKPGILTAARILRPRGRLGTGPSGPGGEAATTLSFLFLMPHKCTRGLHLRRVYTQEFLEPNFHCGR